VLSRSTPSNISRNVSPGATGPSDQLEGLVRYGSRSVRTNRAGPRPELRSGTINRLFASSYTPLVSQARSAVTKASPIVPSARRASHPNVHAPATICGADDTRQPRFAGAAQLRASCAPVSASLRRFLTVSVAKTNAASETPKPALRGGFRLKPEKRTTGIEPATLSLGS
jgi:hypothetical protein